jgi:hypothetical protein
VIAGIKSNRKAILRDGFFACAVKSITRQLEAAVWRKKNSLRGLNRLREKDSFRREIVKSIPQGLKATLIYCHLHRG